MNLLSKSKFHKVWVAFIVGVISATNSFSEGKFKDLNNQSQFNPEIRAKPDNVILLGATKIGNRLLAVGERGRIFYSDDIATSWKQSSTPSLSTLTAVTFVNENIGIAVGHRGVILKTSDGGISWKNVKVDDDDPQAILNVWMRGDHGIAVGAYGYYLETDDQGNTWRRLKIINKSFDLHLNAIIADSSKPIMLAGESGTIAKTVGQAKDWKEINSPYEGTFFGGIRLKDGVLLLHGMRGVVFRSADAGKKWRKIELKNYQGAVQSAVQLRDGTVLLVGAAGLIANSKDSGASFTVQQTSERRHISHLVEVNDTQVLIVGEGGARLINPLKPN